MLVKNRRTKTGQVRVTFQIEEPEAKTVQLLGDFNGWQSPLAMRRSPDGTWRIALDLEPGREYGFRYVIDGTRWANDAKADNYAANPYGSENSVVVT